MNLRLLGDCAMAIRLKARNIAGTRLENAALLYGIWICLSKLTSKCRICGQIWRPLWLP